MSKRDCGMHDGTGYCPYCGIAEANRKLHEMGVLSTAPVPDRIEEEEGISTEEAARLGYELSAERPTTEEGEERYGWNRQLSHASQVWVLREEAESHFDAFVEGQEDAREDLRAQLVAAEHSRDVLHGQIAAAQAEVAELKEEKEQKRKDRADGWWLDLNLEELREEFACLEELECENQAAVAELGAQCLEKSTDGIWTLGNMLHDERAEVSRLRELLQVAEGALAEWEAIELASDGEVVWEPECRKRLRNALRSGKEGKNG